MHLRDLLIQPHDSLDAAMRRMTANRLGVLFVCDEQRRLLGSLSDGDVRRALIQGTLASSPAGKVMNPDCLSASSPEQARALLAEFSVAAIPLLTSDREVAGAWVDGRPPFELSGEPLPGNRSSDAALRSRVAAIIPARGGSKRIAKKNIAKAGGRTLLEWAIHAARGAASVGHVIVSTDDPGIAEVAARSGAPVPWLRPPELATDTAGIVDVLVHAVSWAMTELPGPVEFALLLEPTAPLRTPAVLDEAVRLLSGSGADSVVSVCQLPHVFHPEEALVITEGELKPYLPDRTMDTRRLRGRQEPAYVLNGLVYAFRCQTLLSTRSFYGSRSLPLLCPWEDYLDVDTQTDLRAADAALRTRTPWRDQPGE